MAADRLTVFLFVLGSLIINVDCQNCGGQATCGQCIGQAGCAWCSQEMFNGVRCQAAVNMSSSCPEEFVADPSSSLGMQTFSTEDNSPINTRQVELSLRVGDPQSFDITVTPQRNLPLDLYILIDLSFSMTNELATIQNIASRIGDQINTVTSNVRLGFGSFNDKIIQPFTFIPLEVTDPPLTNYAFRHSVTLTDDNDEFVRVVGEATVTTNADLPENGLEGLAQVITCEDIVGWRPRTNGIGTRVVLFMTDQEFHFAGEGRLAGILNPYNGECLLEPNPNGGPVEFTRFDQYDYPSVGQILDLHRRFDVTTIFAIQQDHIRSYQTLVDTILNTNAFRAVVAGFSVDDSGESAQTAILDLIETEYRRILQGVSLDTTNITSNVSIEVTPSCPSEARREGTSCQEVSLESSVNFTVTVTLNSCEGLVHGQEIRHTVTSPSFGTFDLVLTPICNCECASMDGERSDCSDFGVPRCGVCECDEGRCGSTCSQAVGNRTSLDCPRGSVNNQRCSGRGMCDCACICNQPTDPSQMIFGEACECDNFRCTQDDQGRVCSGRGMCCDSVCTCGESPAGNQYRGEPGGVDMCQCEPLEEVCIDPKTNTVCNNRGTCGCQFCKCDSPDSGGDPEFAGMFCDVVNVPTCNYAADEDCISTCRQAYTDTAMPLPPVCSLCNENRPVLFIDEADISPVESDNRLLTLKLVNLTNTILGRSDYSFQSGVCEFEDMAAPCVTEYYIMSNDSLNFAVVVVREEVCPVVIMDSPFGELPVWALAPIILGGLLVLGIITIIIAKIAVIIVDYCEFKRWEKGHKDPDFNPNPLYQSPEQEYTNVAYGRE